MTAADDFRRVRKRFVFAGVVILVLVTCLGVLLYGSYDGTTKWSAVAAAVLAALGILFSFFIAYRQDGIALRTQAYTQSLDAARNRRDRIAAFFGIDMNARDTTVPYVVPVVPGDAKKPLPLVNGGDFYIVNVLSRLLENRLDPHLVYDDGGEVPTPESVQSAGSPVVYLCSPRTNLVLAQLLPVFDASSGGTPPEELPAWFAEREDWDYMRISEKVDFFRTPESDEIYKYKVSHPDHRPSGTVECIGLLARLSIQGKRIIVLAGAHQYGTWIVGEALYRLLEEDLTSDAARRIMFSDDEVVSVYSGTFDHDTLTVRDGITCKKTWSKANDGTGWVPVTPVHVPSTRR